MKEEEFIKQKTEELNIKGILELIDQEDLWAICREYCRLFGSNK